MKSYLGITLILWCLFPSQGMSKVDSLTVNEMKECFYGSTQKGVRPIIPEDIDVLVNKNGKTVYYLSHTDFLKKADGNDLPPSRYVIRKDNYEKYHLYWVGLRNHNAKKENKLKAKLKKSSETFILIMKRKPFRQNGQPVNATYCLMKHFSNFCPSWLPTASVPTGLKTAICCRYLKMFILHWESHSW